MEYGKPITEEMIQRFKKNYEEDKNAIMLTGVAAQTQLDQLAFIPAKAVNLRHSFSIDLKTRGITFQKKSGRCWLFATMNIMRELVAEKCNLDKFEFSNNYGAFWDKFEKVNTYLENAIRNADLDVLDRYVDRLFKGFGDEGYWDYAVNVIKKYGCVPDYVMPETYQSENTMIFLKKLNTLLRKDILELRALVKNGIDPQPRKEEMLQEFFKAFCICFGEPVSQFDFEYTDKNGEHHADYGITPKQFYEKYVGKNLEDYVTIIHAPTEGHPYNKMYTVKQVTNVLESKLLFMNVEMERLKELTLKQLSDKEITWFGCDCLQGIDRAKGIWDEDCFDYGMLFGGVDLSMTKAEKETSHEAYMNHAMALTGVNFGQDGKPDRWKIENSWGAEAGVQGYYVASDKWFDDNVYGCVIHKKYLSDAELELLNDTPIELEPWDPVSI